MEFRNVHQINTTIVRRLPELAGRFDGVVGLSPPAMLVARVLALHLRLPLIDASGLGEGAPAPKAEAPGRWLAVELAIDESSALDKPRKRLERALPGAEPTFAAVYATAQAAASLDLVMEDVPSRPSFEWDFLDREGLDRVCFDIDGVLCEDPTTEQNDDGPLYRAFLESARPLHRPRGPVGWLVTSRLEKYRAATEAWMRAQGIVFGELRMIDLPNKEARKAANCHGSFKAEVYAEVDADLFIESNPAQAWEIAHRTGKPVFCVDTMTIVDPALPPPAAAAAPPPRRGLLGKLGRVPGKAKQALSGGSSPA